MAQNKDCRFYDPFECDDQLQSCVDCGESCCGVHGTTHEPGCGQVVCDNCFEQHEADCKES